MSFFRCYHCKSVFSEDYAETRSELVDSGPGYQYYQSFYVCPNCGSDNIDEFTPPYDGCEDADCDGDCDNCALKDEIEEGGA